MQCSRRGAKVAVAKQCVLFSASRCVKVLDPLNRTIGPAGVYWYTLFQNPGVSRFRTLLIELLVPPGCKVAVAKQCVLVRTVSKSRCVKVLDPLNRTIGPGGGAYWYTLFQDPDVSRLWTLLIELLVPGCKSGGGQTVCTGTRFFKVTMCQGIDPLNRTIGPGRRPGCTGTHCFKILMCQSVGPS